MRRLRIIFRNLTRAQDLRTENLKETIIQQLRQQGRFRPDYYRYKLTVNILQGELAPAKDLDNYEKPLSDAITASRLLWKDDDQKETMRVQRVKYRSGPRFASCDAYRAVRGTAWRRAEFLSRIMRFSEPGREIDVR